MTVGIVLNQISAHSKREVFTFFCCKHCSEYAQFPGKNKSFTHRNKLCEILSDTQNCLKVWLILQEKKKISMTFFLVEAKLQIKKKMSLSFIVNSELS